MIDLRRTALPVPVFVVLIIVSLLVAACAGAASDTTAPDTAPPTTPDPVATDDPDPTSTDAPSPSAPDDAILDPETPTACLSLGAPDCERARALAATTLTPDDPPVSYVQVGPFGCSVGERCASTLAARPQGDVVIEFDAGQGINVHLEVAPDGTFEATRGEAMGVAVEPTSAGPLPAGPIESTLGHCGVFSGIDLGGHWWDPVGPVPTDSGDSVNATAGVIVVTDPTHATFTAPSGFALQLQRRDGPKLLPFCM